MIPIFLWILGLSIAGLLAYEFVALWNQHPGDTISEIIWAASQKYPLIPFLIGFIGGMLAGHFFWQRSA